MRREHPTGRAPEYWTPAPPAVDTNRAGRYAKHMVEIESEVLSRIAEELTAGRDLTPAERAEVLRIARGFACKDSAAATNTSPETIRARRKRIYRKLGVTGASETLSSLLALSLQHLGGRMAAAEARGAREQHASVTLH